MLTALPRAALARAAALATAAAIAGVSLLPGTAAADSVRSSQQWVLDMLDVSPAWQVTQGEGVTVAVIDSGVNPHVSDLTGAVSTGPDYTGVDTSRSDQNWGVHGTWMASLIAGHGHDDGGLLGVAPRAHVMSIRVIPDRADPHYSQYEHEAEGAIQQSLANGIDYAVGHGAQVISMSIGYSAPSGPVRQALQDAFDHGVTVVASAGNSGSGDTGSVSSPASFPADYPGVISVGAVDADGSVASFSSDNLSVQVAAPGVSVPAQGRDGQYWYVSGTSPACALVAGVAALIKAHYPRLAPNLVARAMTSTTSDRPQHRYDNEVGFGIVDAAAALRAASRLSGAQVASVGNAEVRGASGVGGQVHFGGGAAALPPAPVQPRGSGQLAMLGLLALTSLVLTGAAATRLVLARKSRL